MNRNLASMALLALASLSSANLFLINSTDPYLRANGENPFTPNAIDLNANGFFAGQTVRLSRVGSYNHLGGATPTDYGLTAVFSSTNVILPPPLLNRIPGAIDAGPDWTSPNTFVGGLPTDISEDFMVDNLTGTANGITLVIPVGAQFIFASAIAFSSARVASALVDVSGSAQRRRLMPDDL